MVPPTPAAMMSAPTPGSYVPSTPGNFIPTTPAGGLPQTPFMPSGGDYGHVDDQGKYRITHIYLFAKAFSSSR